MIKIRSKECASIYDDTVKQQIIYFGNSSQFLQCFRLIQLRAVYPQATTSAFNKRRRLAGIKRLNQKENRDKIHTKTYESHTYNYKPNV